MVYESRCFHCDGKIPEHREPGLGYQCAFCGKDPFDDGTEQERKDFPDEDRYF